MEELARIVNLFKEKGPRFLMIDEPIRIEGMAPKKLYVPKIQWDALWEYYELPKGDVVGKWQEKIAISATEAQSITDSADVKLCWATSHDLRASRLGKLPSTLEGVAVMGITITKDQQIVLGVRGGEVTPERKLKIGAGLYGLAPGGSVKWEENYPNGPLVDTLLEEFRTEIGGFNVEYRRLLGIFKAFTPGPKGYKFVALLQTDATLRQIQSANRSSNDLYREKRDSGATHEAAKKEVEEAGFPEDGWEHFPIIGIANNKSDIQALLKTQPQSFAGIGYGGLFTYINSL